jgi:NUMOD4 motif/HNH endonuclease
MSNSEIWKPVFGFERKYEISNLGKVRSILTFDALGRPKQGKEIALCFDKYGYHNVYLSYHDGSKFTNKRLRVHRLIAIVFIPNPNNLPFVNHIDGVKTNNTVFNLEWCTGRHNTSHAIKLGLLKHPIGEKAYRFQSPILVFKAGLHIDTLYGNADALRKGYEIRNVSACLFNKRKTHRGCTFKRLESL